MTWLGLGLANPNPNPNPNLLCLRRLDRLHRLLQVRFHNNPERRALMRHVHQPGLCVRNTACAELPAMVRVRVNVRVRVR